MVARADKEVAELIDEEEKMKYSFVCPKCDCKQRPTKNDRQTLIGIGVMPPQWQCWTCGHNHNRPTDRLWRNLVKKQAQ